jgi:hypothetical protein
VIFSKLELNDAELNFKNKVAGLHTFCLKLSSRSRTVAHRVLPSRAKKQPRMVAVDIQVDKTLHHDRAREGDVAFIMDEVSDVQREVQVLLRLPSGLYSVKRSSQTNSSKLANLEI